MGDDVSCEAVQAGGALLFEAYRSRATAAHMERVRRVFVPLPTAGATRASAVVRRVADSLPDDELARFDAKPAAVDTRKEFGCNIKFVALTMEPLTDEYAWMDEPDAIPDAIPTAADFSMQYVEGQGGVAAGRSRADRLDTGWLMTQVEEQFAGEATPLGMSAGDMCATIFEVLTSKRSDAELQNEVRGRR